MKKRIILIPLCLLLIVALFLGACTKATPISTTSAKATTTIPTATTKPSVAPTTTKPATTGVTTTAVKPTTTTPEVNKSGGTFRIVWTDTSPLMGYPVTASNPGLWYASFAVQTLIEGSNTPQVYLPSLATSWDLAADKSSYTFKLRKGVKFSDGTDFNAAAVKWNFDNMITAKRNEVAYIKSVEIIDDYTVKFNLLNWNSIWLSSLGRSTSQIISPTSFQKNGQEWANVHPIGTGPFILTEYEQSLYTKYKRNPNYWEPGIPYFDKVEIYTIKDPMTRQAMLLAGQAEGARELEATSARALVNTGKYTVELGAMGNFVFSFNNIDPSSAWSKPQMRLALEYAIDKQTLSDSLGNGFTLPSYQVMNAIWQVPNNNPTTTPRKYDPVKAAQLIKEAGYPTGLKTSVELNVKFNGDFIVALQAQLAKVGINVEINPISQAVWQQLSLQATLPNVLRYNRARGSLPEVLIGVNEDLASNSLQYPGLKRPDGWDALLAQALQESDSAKQLQILNQMEQKAYDVLMFVPIYMEMDINVWSAKLKNDRGPILFWAGNWSASHVRYGYLTK